MKTNILSKSGLGDNRSVKREGGKEGEEGGEGGRKEEGSEEMGRGDCDEEEEEMGREKEGRSRRR